MMMDDGGEGGVQGQGGVTGLGLPVVSLGGAACVAAG